VRLLSRVELKSINERMSKARANECESHGFKKVAPSIPARDRKSAAFLSLANDALLEYIFKALFCCE